MIRIGITGGIGSGKSTVCRLFGMLGIPVYDSDSRARALMNGDATLRRRIADLLGEEVYRDGTLDRQRVAERVFADSALLEALNRIVHPAVGRDFSAWADRYAGGGNGEIPPYVILESAILVESGFDRYVDRVVTVTAPEEVRVARTVERDGVSPEKVRARIAAQSGEEERMARADRVIRNDDRESLIVQVEALHTWWIKGGK